MNSTLVPDSYDIALGGGHVLHVRTRESENGEQPRAVLEGAYFEADVRNENVAFAIEKIAVLLDTYAATLRRMAPHLPSAHAPDTLLK